MMPHTMPNFIVKKFSNFEKTTNQPVFSSSEIRGEGISYLRKGMFIHRLGGIKQKEKNKI